MPQKVLFINYYFPPQSYSGTHRIAKFAKYLPNFDWIPIILKPKVVIGTQTDEKLFEEVKDKVIMEPAPSFASLLIKKTLTPLPLSKGEPEGAPPYPFPRGSWRGSLPTLLNTLATKLLRPDTQILWTPFALIKGVKIAKKHHPKIIFASASPFSIFIIATLLKKLTRIPLVLSLHDPWTLNPYMKWNTWLNRRFEKWVIKNSTKCVFTTESTQKIYAEKYPKFADRFTTIFNGFDEEDLAPRETPPLKLDQKKFNIVYTGVITPFRSPEPFFKTVKTLLDKNPKFKPHLAAHFFGQFENDLEIHLQKKLHALGLEKNIIFHGFLSHSDCVAHLKAADCLLFLTGDSPGGENIIAGKTFEYMAIGKPILALTYPHGEAAQILKKSGLGFVHQQNDISGAAETLKTLYLSKQFNTINPQLRPGFINQFSRENLTRSLATLFNKITAKQHENRPGTGHETRNHQDGPVDSGL